MDEVTNERVTFAVPDSPRPQPLVQTPTNSPMKVVKRRLNSPASSPARKSPRVRGSPRRQVSRLPIRRTNHARPVVKELNLPPDESVFTSPPAQPGTKVTPEKLMQELKEQVAKKMLLQRTRKMVEVDDEISIPFNELVVLNSPPTTAKDSPLARKGSFESIESLDEPISRPVRVSTRIHSQVTVESPDLPQEDYLLIARQTLHNTRYNSGYKTCQLVFTNEFIDKPRPDSPEHAFSQQMGLQRHILKLPDGSSSDSETEGKISRRKLKFNRLLHFLDSEDDVDVIDENVMLNQAPSKPCLIQKQSLDETIEETSKRSVIQVKRLIYPGSVAATVLESSTAKPRRLFGGAKRAPARNQ